MVNGPAMPAGVVAVSRPAAIKAFRLACEPVSVMLGEPAPLTVTPPPLLALNTAGSPETDRLSSPLPASGSARLMPVSAVATPWVTFCAAGELISGFSLTLLRLMVKTLSKLSPPWSVLRTVTA